MSNFAPFVSTFGLYVAAVALVAAWLFRTTNAPVHTKLSLPILLVGLAGLTTFRVPLMMGLPVETTIAAMPDEVQLVAFWPDGKKKVDLWVFPSDGRVRAYKVDLTPSLQKLLTEARELLADGIPVHLKLADIPKVTGGDGNDYGTLHFGGENTGGDYVILPNTVRVAPDK
jgi:hypothetical protein